MAARYRRWMAGLYVACIALSGLSLVVITLIIPWGVYTRYVLNRGSSWPEPMATLLMALFTFTAAAAGYRASSHLSVHLLTERMPSPVRMAVAIAVDAAMGALSLFVVIWGMFLVQTTWGQVIAEFPWLSVGVTYLPVPVGGVITLLFIAERIWLGPPPPDHLLENSPLLD